jgi:hypothetical protein
LVDEPILCYPFLDLHWAGRAAEKARRIIIAKRLPLTATADWKWFGKSYRPVLIIEPVPEEYIFRDEVPGEEEFVGGWWNKSEE